MPVNIQPCGRMMKLSFQDSSKYAGIVNLPVLSKVLNDYSIRFTATLVASSPQSNQTRRMENKYSVSRHHACLVRITVCGIKSEITAISDMFSKAELYFQQTETWNTGIPTILSHQVLKCRTWVI